MNATISLPPLSALVLSVSPAVRLTLVSVLGILLMLVVICWARCRQAKAIEPATSAVEEFEDAEDEEISTDPRQAP